MTEEEAARELLINQMRRRKRFRAAGGNGGFSSSHPLLLTRATEAWAQDKSGNLFAFGVNQRRLTNAGLTITGAATRLHGEAPANGGDSGATSSALSAEGLFNPVRSVSAGATWHARTTGTLSIVSGTPVYIRARVRAGTSGSVRLAVRDTIAAAESFVSATFSAPAVLASDAAGTLTQLVNRLLPNGDREFTFTWTPNSTSAAGRIQIGPESAISGEYIDIIGMQATSQFSEWIMGGAGAVAQAADVASLDLAGVSMAAGFMLRMDGTVLATPRVIFDRFYQADTGTNNTRTLTYIAPSSGSVSVEQFSAGVAQGVANTGAVLSPPSVFSLVGAHGVNYIGGAWAGVVATPDTTADYEVPTTLRIGSTVGAGSNLPLLLTNITLFPEAPTTPRVTEVAA